MLKKMPKIITSLIIIIFLFVGVKILHIVVYVIHKTGSNLYSRI
jgi:hypothetical protein